MSLFLIYSLFALTTAFTSVFEILHPVMQDRLKEPSPVEGKLLHYLSFFCVSLLIAPIVFLSCVVPSMGERFREALYSGLFPKD